MAGTRSSARLSGSNSSPPSEKSASGTKRKAEETTPSSKSKRGRPSKEQKTLDETMPAAEETRKEEDAVAAAKEDHKKEETASKEVASGELEDTNGEAKHEETTAEADAGKGNEDETNGDAKHEGDGEPMEDVKASGEENGGQNALDQVKADAGEDGTTTKDEEPKEDAEPSTTVATDAVEEDKEREKAMPSNILEKGIIYFFTRGRVGVEDPDSVQDLARSYFVLRPLPHGAKLTDGAIQDVGNNRLVSLPKKVWPKSGKDRFMVFVEKSKVTMETLKEEFFSGSEYSTKTTGTRQNPEVTPLGEGVYAITSTGGGQGNSHLAYMLTIPSKVGEVQKDVGLAEKGSFVLSVKNPESSTPGSAQLPNAAEYPKEILEEFRGRGWMPAHPKHIDYTNASMLLIGEDFDNSSNLDAAPKDEKTDKETPQEELEKLGNEDELRVENLKGDDTIFEDLGISSKEYPKVMTTW